MNRRTLIILISVVCLHVLALWALHTGLLQRQHVQADNADENNEGAAVHDKWLAKRAAP